MPELPDLTVFAESLQARVSKRTIEDAAYLRETRLNLSPQEFQSALKGKKIVSVTRVGKQLLFTLDSDDRFLIHLMLSGGFALVRRGNNVSFPVLTVDFADGESLVLFDPKGIATVTFKPDLGRFAVDALDLTPAHLKELLHRKPKMTLKEFLIDQSLIAGIGNAYADEILWQARISPKSITGKIPEEALAQLASAIPQVLKGATDYLRQHHPGMMAGEMRDHLAVHKPKAKQSPTGAKIMIELIATKKTYFTEEQVLYR